LQKQPPRDCDIDIINVFRESVHDGPDRGCVEERHLSFDNVDCQLVEVLISGLPILVSGAVGSDENELRANDSNN
jgi:hypothetical protein